MNMHRTRIFALASLAAALTMSAMACGPQANAPVTTTPQLVTVEVTRLVDAGQSAPTVAPAPIAAPTEPTRPTAAPPV